MSQIKAPNRHLMAFVTFLSLVPMVYFVPDFVAQYTGGIKWLNVVVSVGIIVPIISYIIMPLTIKFFK